MVHTYADLARLQRQRELLLTLVLAPETVAVNEPARAAEREREQRQAATAPVNDAQRGGSDVAI
ncbi:hypothetical protein [Amycolatopsis sp. GM8]|uniref:hypothetical protein n=1 Tax=Amycolatopsis sp. GM8 TaxID=2896530 RepID=UPI001F3CABEF|nr:hypothetical protein [Amycolatopsis sp. GM8]